MLKGKYIFRSNGEIISEGENIITANGAYMINRYLANSSTDWAGSIAVGLLETTSASTDTTLAYEIYRTPITLKSYVPGTPNKLAFKATLNPNLVANIYEVGVIPLNHIVGANKDNIVISSFDEVSWQTGSSLGTLTSASQVSTNTRAGSYNISSSAVGYAVNNNFYSDLSAYNTNDFLQLLYYVSTAGTSPSITVTFVDNNSASWTTPVTLLPTTSSGFYSASIALTNSPDSGFNYNVGKVTLRLTGGTGTIQYDCLKIMSGATKPPELKLVSRRSSTTPLITKTMGQSVDIEYYLTVM
jgi:hypothetical protein